MEIRGLNVSGAVVSYADEAALFTIASVLSASCPADAKICALCWSWCKKSISIIPDADAPLLVPRQLNVQTKSTTATVTNDQ